MRTLFALALAVLLLAPAAGRAVPASDLDERAKNLAGQLRCLVCQNQTIADSNAELAR